MENKGTSSSSSPTNSAQADTPNDTSASQPLVTTLEQLCCPLCTTSFTRLEHLKRHIRSHSDEKPYCCTICQKKFTRQDTLQRHGMIHSTSAGPTDASRQASHSTTGRAKSACRSCAKARAKCSGGTVCSRCTRKSLGCVYRSNRRGRCKSGQNDASRSESVEVTSQPNGVNQWNTHTHVEDVSASRHDYGELAPANTQSDVMRDSTILESPGPQNPARSDRSAQEKSLPEHHSHQFGHQMLLPEDDQPISTGSYTIRSTQNDMGRTDQGVTDDSPTFADAVTPQWHIQINGSSVYVDHSQLGFSSDHQQPLDMGLFQSGFDNSTLSAANWFSDGFVLEGGQSNLIVDQDQFSPNDFYPMGEPPVLSATTTTTGRSTIGRTSTLPAESQFLQQSFGGGNMQGLQFSNRREPDRESDMMALPHAAGTNISSSNPLGLSRSFQDLDHVRLPNRADAMIQSSGTPSYTFAFLDMSKISPPDVRYDSLQIPLFIPATYERILHYFNQTCQESTILFKPFASPQFPSLEVLGYFTELYFTHFHPVFPVLHRATFHDEDTNWLLVLAAAAIGSQYLVSEDDEGYGRAMLEFLRRVILVEVNKQLSDICDLQLVQARLLNCIGMLYCGDPRLRAAALQDFPSLTASSDLKRMLCCAHSVREDLSTASTVEENWRTWLVKESISRTGYSLWMVHSLIHYAYDHNYRRIAPLEDFQARLPCNESLWDAESPGEWHNVYYTSTTNPSFRHALQALVVQKKFNPSIGEFSTILLIHGLIQILWDLGSYWRRPLSLWTPTTKNEKPPTLPQIEPAWLPGVYTYSNWRNNLCDSFDVLHFAANSKIASASTKEHPTVCHLHVARLIILTPHQEMHFISMLQSGYKHQNLLVDDLPLWQRQIQLWVSTDQCKARLAIIHAGAVLWYIRRFSTNAFNEPVAVYKATLVLWNYGLYGRSKASQEHRRANSDGGSPSSMSSSSIPTSIRLDRPCDHELVHHFVREGYNMRAIVSGVGNICKREGPNKILREGCKLLRTLRAWRVSREYEGILTGLMDQEREDSGSTSNLCDSL